MHVPFHNIFQYVLYISEDRLPDRLKSGGHQLVRRVSSGQHTFDTDHLMYPVTEPMPKIAAKMQVTYFFLN